MILMKEHCKDCVDISPSVVRILLFSRISNASIVLKKGGENMFLLFGLSGAWHHQ